MDIFTKQLFIQAKKMQIVIYYIITLTADVDIKASCQAYNT